MSLAVLIVAGCAALGALIGVLYPLRPAVVTEHRRSHVVAPVTVPPSQPVELAAPSVPALQASAAGAQPEQPAVAPTAPDATSTEVLEGASSPRLAARDIETPAPATAAVPPTPVAQEKPVIVEEKPAAAAKPTRAAVREEGAKRRRRDENGTRQAGPPNQQLPIPLIGTLLSLFAPPT